MVLVGRPDVIGASSDPVPVAEVIRHRTEVQRIDLELLSDQFGGDLAPVYVDLASPRPDTYPEPIAAPELTDGPHLSYMVQWFIFGTMATLFAIAALAFTAARLV
jgi:cytochrome oxidase assembly protein ShyY1